VPVEGSVLSSSAVAGDEFAGWYRVGGHRLQFYATDAEIAEWLQEILPPESAPYSIVGQEWQDGRWQPFEYALAAIDECFMHHRSNNLWIRSDVLATRRERRRPEYLRIFERLRRSMRQRLVVTTAYTFPDGSVSESWPMTARAADAHSRGEVTFTANPVGLRS
jgi:hypothetical protein